jgi:apolipoprotein N-acyltransferase
VASTINWIWDRWDQDRSARKPGWVAISVVAFAVLGFGIIRLSVENDEQLVRVACIVAPDTFNDEYLDDLYTYTRGIEVSESSTARARERIQQSLEEHFELVENAAAQKPDFIVWPEANAVLTLEEEGDWIERAQETAADKQVFVGMGLIVFRPGTGKGTFNKFVLVDPSGKVVMDSLKATQVPGSLNTQGDGILPVVESGFGRLSSAICFDMDFPQVIAQAGRAKIDLFLAPSNDWLEVRDIHAQMARMRAIEQGFALVRPTKDGTTMMTDSAGRILACLTSPDDRSALLVADIPVKRRFTLYSLTGDSFAILCGLAFLSILSMAGFRGRSTSRLPDFVE